MSGPILAFKAGRAFRRGDTNFVDPDPTKGAILLESGEDGLLHFQWKNRVTNNIIEDLILFPGDASFVRAGSRIYVLRFSSSNQRHFFWMQDQSSARDDEFVQNVNRLLEDPDAAPIWATPGSSTSAATAGPSTSTAAQPGRYQHDVTPEQLDQLRAMVARYTTEASAGYSAPPSLALGDVLTPANLSPLFASHPELVPALFPHLPPDLPSPPSREVLEQIIASPQFRAAVRGLDQALRTGMLGGLMRGLGLPEEAGLSVEEFLKAIREQAGREESGGESMDTD